MAGEKESSKKALEKRSLAEGKFALLALIKSQRGGFSIAGDNAGDPRTSSHLLLRQKDFKTPRYLGARFGMGGNALGA